MKYIYSCIVAAIVTISSVSMADPDLTLVGPLKAQETKSVKVPIVQGEQTIEVWSSYDHNDFTCRFYDESGNLGLEQKSTSRCIGKLNSEHHGYVRVAVTNEQNKAVDYRITVQKN